MKIRCGSHQQNRSIVRPGLSLMATKVALTAEEFRENSQRSIDLFNTEKLSTDSTHVLKSAYCILCISAVAICTGRVEAKLPALLFHALTAGCNLHGACGGKVLPSVLVATNTAVAICTGRVEAKPYFAFQVQEGDGCNLHGACGGKAPDLQIAISSVRLQSARGVWRQSVIPPTTRQAHPCCNLHGACGGKDLDSVAPPGNVHVAICTGRVEAKRQLRLNQWVTSSLQSARGVWRQRGRDSAICPRPAVAICTGRVEAKMVYLFLPTNVSCCNLHGACGGKATARRPPAC